MTSAPRKEPPPMDEKGDARSPAETERIRENTIRNILNTPPKRHDEMVADRRKKESKRDHSRK